MSKQKVNPSVLKELQELVSDTGSNEPMVPRFVRLPRELDEAVNDYVSKVKGMDRSKLMRQAVARYLGWKRPGARSTKSSTELHYEPLGDLEPA